VCRVRARRRRIESRRDEGAPRAPDRSVQRRAESAFPSLDEPRRGDLRPRCAHGIRRSAARCRRANVRREDQARFSPRGRAMTGEPSPRTARVASAIVATIAVSSLIGWIYDIAPLKTVLPGFVTMKVNTSLCLLGCAIALFLQSDPETTRARAR